MHVVHVQNTIRNSLWPVLALQHLKHVGLQRPEQQKLHDSVLLSWRNAPRHASDWPSLLTHTHVNTHSTAPPFLRLNTAMAISVPQTDSSNWRSLILREALFTGWVPSTWGDFLPPAVRAILKHPYVCISRIVDTMFTAHNKQQCRRWLITWCTVLGIRENKNSMFRTVQWNLRCIFFTDNSNYCHCSLFHL